MIEADVILGNLTDDPTKTIPIMGHPPNSSSDLSLESFLKQVQTYDNTKDSKKKGIKLDFKTIEVFEASKEIVANVAVTVSGKYISLLPQRCLLLLRVNVEVDHMTDQEKTSSIF